MRRMPWTNNATIDALRMKYNAAFSAHQSCDKALIDVRLCGEVPSQALKEAEIRARAELAEARDRLLAAMTAAITGHAAAELGAGASSNEPVRSPDDT